MKLERIHTGTITLLEVKAPGRLRSKSPEIKTRCIMFQTSQASQGASVRPAWTARQTPKQPILQARCRVLHNRSAHRLYKNKQTIYHLNLQRKFLLCLKERVDYVNAWFRYKCKESLLFAFKLIFNWYIKSYI